MPIDYKKYPKNWKTEIRPSILIRAGGFAHSPKVAACCENCGLRNYDIGVRNEDGSFRLEHPANSHMEAKRLLNQFNLRGMNTKRIIIVLTVAHLDHDIKNNDLANLKALCQLCHNRHDAGTRGRKV